MKQYDMEFSCGPVGPNDQPVQCRKCGNVVPIGNFCIVGCGSLKKAGFRTVEIPDSAHLLLERGQFIKPGDNVPLDDFTPTSEWLSDWPGMKP